ncbi:hypothetical protein Rsub_10403 [Raphidocelis subcapitata]|uniref:Uncharacterized protein n=1 Tax=Raphidocelis subcapitata TaxID=307507 RepID=A0A2V0PHV0_9CHLO|nr:hypothetical protein Rsub_10403 [Raphidocelis subcapitata]|eukprot:GBF97480.1 hypothetical protein Rsub_10403 [Raphidocelis subcapitata]
MARRALAVACLLLVSACAAQSQHLGTAIPPILPPLPIGAVINAIGAAPAIGGALANAALGGAGALADAAAIAANAGVIVGSLPAFGAIQGSVKSIALNIIKALNGLGIAASQAGAAGANIVGAAATAPLLAKAKEVAAYHNALLNEAGKAVGSGITAVETATAPFRGFAPDALALEALVANTQALGVEDLSPSGKRLLLGPSIGALKVAGASLAAFKDVVVGRTDLLTALGNAAGGALGPGGLLPGPADLANLFGSAVGLITGLPLP